MPLPAGLSLLAGGLGLLALLKYRKLIPLGIVAALLLLLLPQTQEYVARLVAGFRGEDLAAVVLGALGDDEALLDSIVAGAAGYVLKQIRGNELVTSIRRVAAGQMLHDAATRERAIERLRRAPDEDNRLASLTPQERKILVLLTEGLTNRQIGERMSLAEKTVKNYITNLLSKLGMKRRTEAAVYAARSKGLT